MIKIELLNRALIIAVTTLTICQIFKFIFYSIKNKCLEWHYFVSPGGMPSTHSAFVTSLTFSIGFLRGFNTEIFAISFVYAGIIVYDSFRLRGTVGIHSRILSSISHLIPEEKKENIPLMVGHTIPEIIVGVIIGIIFAFILKFIFV